MWAAEKSINSVANKQSWPSYSAKAQGTFRTTSRTANLCGDLLDELSAQRTAISRSTIYAATCRGRRSGPRWRLESWEHELAVGAASPTLPLCLSEDFIVPLDLDATYDETCRSLRIR